MGSSVSASPRWPWPDASTRRSRPHCSSPARGFDHDHAAQARRRAGACTTFRAGAATFDSRSRRPRRCRVNDRTPRRPRWVPRARRSSARRKPAQARRFSRCDRIALSAPAHQAEQPAALDRDGSLENGPGQLCRRSRKHGPQGLSMSVGDDGSAVARVGADLRTPSGRAARIRRRRKHRERSKDAGAALTGGAPPGRASLRGHAGTAAWLPPRSISMRLVAACVGRSVVSAAARRFLKSVSSAPVTPSVTTSRGPVTGYAATGTPHAIASKRSTRPNVSVRLGNSRTRRRTTHNCASSTP